MKQIIHLCFSWGIAFWCLLLARSIEAQIIPDTTLPNNSSITNQGNISTLNGGTRVGRNLFHSFSDFSVPTNNVVHFNNALDIQNIISRVTGKSISNINGLIQANGTANFLLLNPNGISFGSKASLNIGGSFLGTTANSISFADGTHFGSNNSQSSPLLTVSVPISLNLGSNSGDIHVIGEGHSLVNLLFSPIIGFNNATGLVVQPGKTIALVGGNLNLEGGILRAESGRIELDSVDQGSVSLIPSSYGWTLDNQGGIKLKDISLSRQALVDVSGISGGFVVAHGRLVSVRDGSAMLIQNRGYQQSGNISINASDSLEVSGTTSNGNLASTLLTETIGTGSGGDINVSTRRVVVESGGQILPRTFSIASAGNLIINASEFVQVTGTSREYPNLFSNITTATFGFGSAGGLKLSTSNFVIKDGGNVSSGTLGRGKGGNTTINATNSIEVSGGNSGSGSALGTSTENTGDAGNLTINTSRLLIKNGGSVNSSTLAVGNSGKTIINASNSVEIDGTLPGSFNPSNLSSSASAINNPAIQQILGIPSVPRGAPAGITINTGHFSVKNGALVNVRNDGSGDAGAITVNARSIFLDNKGGITASSTSGQGGNIFLNAQNLQLRHNSPITASAGGSGNGGNITIRTGTLVGLENSPITANSSERAGGNINITAQGIFSSPDSPITATGGRPDLNGTVRINILDITPLQALTVSQPKPADLTKLIASGCKSTTGPNANKFTIVGSAGLPPSPSDPRAGDAVVEDMPTGTPSHSTHKHSTPKNLTSADDDPDPALIVEANGVATNDKGEVIAFVANAPSYTPEIPWLNRPTCHP